MKRKGNKYHNHKVEYEGIKFDSIKEKDRYIVLKKAEERGEIRELALQVSFELIPPVRESHLKHLKTKDKEVEVTLQRAITYKADFCYNRADGSLVIEDVKASPKRASLDKVFLLKEKLFFWRFGRRITRVYDADAQI